MLDRKIVVSGPLPEIFKGLQSRIRKTNRLSAIEERLKNSMWISILFIIPIILATIIISWIGVDIPTGFVVVPILLCIAGFFLFFILALLVDFFNPNYDTQKLDNLVEIIEAIGEDISTDLPVSLSFDPYMTETRMKYERPASNNTYYFEEFGSHNWLTFSGALLDGNRFTLSVERKTKRSIKDKGYRKKLKENSYEKATLKLRLNARAYPPAGKAAPFIKTIDKVDTFSLSHSCIGERTLRLTGRSKRGEVFFGPGLLRLFIIAYSAIGSAGAAE